MRPYGSPFKGRENWRRFLPGLFLLLVSGIVAGTASAQQSQTQYALQITPEEVRAKATELSNQPVPEREQLLIRELDRIDTEIALANSEKSKANSWSGSKAALDKITAQLSAQSKALAQFDCEKNSNTFADAARTYSRLIGTFARYANDDTINYDRIYLPGFKAADDAEYCRAAKAAVSSPDYVTALQEIIGSVQSGISTFMGQQASVSSEYDKYLDVLKKRRVAIQDKLNSAQSVSQISGNLPLLLAVLAIACVSTILGIKLFDAELQMEWVASGQVIQFVTVMILLSVILALGLSNILKENTLGTLLGGVAGYVLAQGVGRAAARDVSRSKKTADGTANASASSG